MFKNKIKKSKITLLTYFRSSENMKSGIITTVSNISIKVKEFMKINYQFTSTVS